MSRYDKLYKKLDTQNQIALVPFFCLGNPTIDTTMDMIRTAIDAGADALEIGFPFSDPVADGPVLQTANIRGIQSQAYPPKCFEMIKTIRTEFPDIPIGLLLYGNIVYAMGLDTFYQNCADTGVDSVLTPDVPLHAAEEFITSAKSHGIAPIFIAPPNGSDDYIKNIAKHGQAYTYVVARTGVTGNEKNQGQSTGDAIIKSIIDNNAPPPFLGFGISQPEHVTNAINSNVNGVIIGTAIAKIIDASVDDTTGKVDGEHLNAELSDYIKTMKSATHK